MPKSHYSSLSHTQTNTHAHARARRDKAKIFCLGSNCSTNILVMSNKKTITHIRINLNILILE